VKSNIDQQQKINQDLKSKHECLENLVMKILNESKLD